MVMGFLKTDETGEDSTSCLGMFKCYSLIEMVQSMTQKEAVSE